MAQVLERRERPISAATRRTPAGPVQVFEPRRPGILVSLRELWRYRMLIVPIGRRFLLKRYSRTWLGILWLPLKPGVNLATRILVFGGLVGISAGGVPYPLFFIIATNAWTLFNEVAYWATRSLEMNRRVVQSVYVPRLTMLTAAVVPAFIEWLVLTAFAAFGTIWYLARTGRFYLDIGLHTLLVPAGLGLLVMLGLGVGMATATAGARARDIRFTLPFVLSFVYFLTPVIYPISAVPQHWRPYAELNPMTGAIEMVKQGLFARVHELSPDAVGVTLFTVFMLWVPGLWLFSRREAAALRATA